MKQLATLLAISALAAPSLALMPGDKVDNFTLSDHKGEMHELYDLSEKQAVVVMIHGNGCPIARNANPTYKELRDEYAAKGVEFLMLNANIQDTRKSIAKEADEFAIDVPILVDETQAIAESLGVERTADTFVIDPGTWEIVYRGSLDNRLGYETQKLEASENYVADALDAMLADQKPEVAHVEAKGCIVSLPNKQRAAAARGSDS